ncbi:MerC domain-containing protein [bacterium]|nr:MerC domain-containing protein [bacterium]
MNAINDIKNNNGDKSGRGLRGWDLLGVTLSGACLIHCTVLPLILALLPVFGSSFHLDERWHNYMTLLIVPVAMIALVTGYLRHRRNIVAVLGVLSLSMILGAHPLHEMGLYSHLISEIIGTLGGCTLISAHLFNHYYQHKAAGCCCEHDCCEEAEAKSSLVA